MGNGVRLQLIRDGLLVTIWVLTPVGFLVTALIFSLFIFSEKQIVRKYNTEVWPLRWAASANL